IHQDYVPVLSVKKGFNKKEYAEKAAQLVIQKIQQNHVPALTEYDLVQICPVNQLLYEQPAGQ
ncbi:MAG TPA: DUF4907 domain-containing protein, partial [Chitinophagaceae bacterium]|nr:DUF4907 domain-containing protein [Chitinophagaceae bacterium]